MKEVKTVPSLSQQTGVPEWTIRKLIKDGKLPALRMGNRFYIEMAAFEKLFTTQTDEASNEVKVYA